MRPALAACVLLAACGGETGKDPATTAHEPIDRFSHAAGTLLDRTVTAGLPDADQPVDFDRAPFLVHGLGPAGEAATWYLWDAKPRAPAPIYVFVSGLHAVSGQLNVVDVIPGDPGYNDLWLEVHVAVPADYVANTITSVDEILASGYQVTATSDVVNCPMVPDGSTAHRRFPGDYDGLHQGWYRGKVIQYFHFGEKALTASGGQVATTDVYTADGGDGSHDVVSALPADAGYSPLRTRHVYDGAAAATVHDLASAMAAPAVTSAAATINTPIVPN